jgi:hypothetical protein
MRESRCDLLIVGGGTGGTAAAMAATAMGLRVIMTEETDWIGGQLTAQAVPPDEHPWIEQFGCTRRYREFRDRVRRYYRRNYRLTPEAAKNPFLNPGNGWVSRLCFEPVVGWHVLQAMVQPEVSRELLEIRLWRKPIAAAVEGDFVRAVSFVDFETGNTETVYAPYVLDATELGDLLAITGTEYRLGAESFEQTGEPGAVRGEPEWDNVQGITWVYAIGYDPNGREPIEKPRDYEYWKGVHPHFLMTELDVAAGRPDRWPGPLLGFQVLHAHTLEGRKLPLFNNDDWYELFSYRQIIDPKNFADPVLPATIVNWPQNDYFDKPLVDVDENPDWGHPMPGASGPVSASRLEASQQLSWSLLHWLQTEAPRHDGDGHGYPEVYLRKDVVGTSHGLAKYPYIREGRRILARETLCEQDVSDVTNPGCDRMPARSNSVGVGAYRIDLHPSANGSNTLDSSSLPFQIPLGTLIPQRVRNLLPACKNLGVTHISNGCTRLHPIEWNIGESVGVLVGFCHNHGTEPHAVFESEHKTRAYQSQLLRQGIEMAWPKLRAL